MAFVLIISCGALFSACGKSNDPQDPTPPQNPPSHTYYTVTFETNGGSNIASQQVLAGSIVIQPDPPTRDGYYFNGWYSDSSFDTVWNFYSNKVNSDITLYASWTESEPSETEGLTYLGNSTGYTVTGVSGSTSVIVIPQTHNGLPVTEIADLAFQGKKITVVRLPSNLTKIGLSAFARTNLTSVVIPDSVETIDNNAFYNCSELTTVTISPNSKLTDLKNNAFSGCHKLQSIFIPAGATLGDSVFNNCGGLNHIYVDVRNEKYSNDGDNLIEKATNTLIRGSNNSVIPESISKIARNAFSYSTLTELTIPKSVTEIETLITHDSSITKINYKGTAAEWNDIKKNKNWNLGETIELVFLNQS